MAEKTPGYYDQAARMQRLHEECEARAKRRAHIDEQTRLDEIERRMVTGEVHSPMQKRILEQMESFRSSQEELIEETERKMLGLLPPSDVDNFKATPSDPEIGLGSAARKPTPEALRAFILVNGRAPNEEELEELMAPAAPGCGVSVRQR